MLLLPDTGLKEPPTDSMNSATCAALRVFVSFVSIVASKAVDPRFAGSSNSGPPHIINRRCKFGSRRSGCSKSRAPFGSFISVKSGGAPSSLAPTFAAGAEAAGFSEIDVSRPGTRYCRNARFRSAGVTLLNCSKYARL